MNEPLCRALVQARLSEEDVAARLDVDPKTVRRWLEGRIPHLRHRWALAAMLGRDEADLWPELRPSRSWPDDLRAIYPCLDGVPRDLWLRLFGSAEREISILAREPSIIGDPIIMNAVAGRARDGVAVRICLVEPDSPGSTGRNPDLPTDRNPAGRTLCVTLREKGIFGIRRPRATLCPSIYYADDQLLIAQHAYGVSDAQAPVLHLRPTGRGSIFLAYLGSYERIWATAEPLL